MEDFDNKLDEIEQLLKAMTPQIKQKSVGMPQKMRLPKLSAANTVKNPGITPTTQKDPTNVAQQISDPDLKARALSQVKETVRISKNGQWSL